MALYQCGVGSSVDAKTMSTLLHHLGVVNDSVTYMDGASEFSYTATSEQIIHFNYIMNDGADIKINRGEEVIFTLMSGECLTDFEIELNENDVLTFVSDDLVVRSKYFAY